MEYAVAWHRLVEVLSPFDRSIPVSKWCSIGYTILISYRSQDKRDFYGYQINHLEMLEKILVHIFVSYSIVILNE